MNSLLSPHPVEQVERVGQRVLVADGCHRGERLGQGALVDLVFRFPNVLGTVRVWLVLGIWMVWHWRSLVGALWLALVVIGPVMVVTSVAVISGSQVFI